MTALNDDASRRLLAERVSSNPEQPGDARALPELLQAVVTSLHAAEILFAIVGRLALARYCPAQWTDRIIVRIAAEARTMVPIDRVHRAFIALQPLGSTVTLDVQIGAAPAERELIERGEVVDWLDAPVPLATADHLLWLALSSRTATAYVDATALVHSGHIDLDAFGDWCRASDPSVLRRLRWVRQRALPARASTYSAMVARRVAQFRPDRSHRSRQVSADVQSGDSPRLEKGPRSMLSDRFDDAFVWAHKLHRHQRRKGKETPYVAHLMGVASLVLEYGGDEDQAIAALLHDAVEDQGGQPTLDVITSRFGPGVAEIVADCTDAWVEPKPLWRPRKEAFIAGLSHKPPRSLLVCLADKVYNAEAILSDYMTLGDQFWNRFTGGAAGTRWYYRTLADVLARIMPGPLASRLSNAVDGFDRARPEVQVNKTAPLETEP